MSGCLTLSFSRTIVRCMICEEAISAAKAEGCGRLPGAVGAPLTSMAIVMSAWPFRTSKGSGLTSPPSMSMRPLSVTGVKSAGSAMLAATAVRIA